MSDETGVEPQVIEAEQRRRSKIQLKREQIMRERIQRHVNNGLDAEGAQRKIQEEDWQRLNPHDKASRLRDLLFGNVTELARDINVLHANQKGLANTMDVNFRAFEKLLNKLGVSTEDIEKALTESGEEVMSERAAAQAEKVVLAEEATKAKIVATIDQAGAPTDPPILEGATVFGG